MHQIRNSTVDLAKMLAILGVVIIHISPNSSSAESFTKLIGLFCVPYFLLISLYFFIREISKSDRPKLKSLKVDRLILPYIFRTIFYLAIRQIRAVADPSSINPEFKFDWINILFYGGAATQLYFIPLLLYLKIQIFLIHSFQKYFTFKEIKIIKYLSIFCLLIILYTFAMIGYWNSYLGWGQEYNDPRGWSYLLIRSFVYPLLAFLTFKITISKSISQEYLFAFGIFGVLVLGIIDSFSDLVVLRSIILCPLAGFCCSLIALNLKITISNRFLAQAMTTSYGIYLAHIAVWQLYRIISTRLGIVPSGYSILEKLSIGILILLVSGTLIMLIRLSPKLSYFILGEQYISGNKI